MKTLLSNKLALSIILAIVLLAAGLYYFTANKETENQNQNSKTSDSSDFQRTGQNSFGLDVCNEITKDSVAIYIDKPITESKDYSLGTSTGCQYYTDSNNFVVVDVGISSPENQRKGLEIIGRELKTDSGFALDNFIAYSNNQIIDIYLVVDPTLKFVRVGRSSVGVVSNDTLLSFAHKVEEKIMSYK